ncbi:IS3 family transposase [Paraburkholderia sp. RL17-337-BIB-A]|uniref:IS3 family transposase n=1 Tax=Paraburkholderia sp. RL17-337-BIB-A TaxID=3031636 RepID=UPI0038B9FF5D
MIQSLKKVWPVRAMCRVMNVAPSSYYAFAGRTSKSAAPCQQIAAAREIHRETRGSYGSRRMSQELRKRGHAVGRYRAGTLMRQAQLVVTRKRTHRYPKSNEQAQVVPNLLDRNFEPPAINQVWAGDITYVRTLQGWSYLAIVMDLYSRRIVGWSLGLMPDTALVIRALQQALERRSPSPGLMFHSDQGCQGEFNRSLQHLEIGGVKWDDHEVGLRNRRGGHRCLHRAGQVSIS